MRARSLAPNPRDSVATSATTESRMLACVARRSMRSSGVLPAPNNRSKITCGLRSIGKGDVGDINFKLQVPVDSSVDLETRRGNIYVANIRSGLVRAHVSSEGDIELTNISASHVIAQNVIGNIFFDGEFSRGGTYEFKSNKGDITIRIPGNSDFRLVAASPARRIALNDFWNNNFKTQDGRRYVGDVGDGRSSVSVTNFSGQITFLRR